MQPFKNNLLSRLFITYGIFRLSIEWFSQFIRLSPENMLLNTYCAAHWAAPSSINSASPGQDDHHFTYDIFKCILLLKSFVFWLKFHWSLYEWSNWQWPNIGLNNALAPNRRQAIIWTNADPIHWLMYAAVGGDEVKVLCYAAQAIYSYYGQIIVRCKEVISRVSMHDLYNRHNCHIVPATLHYPVFFIHCVQSTFGHCHVFK